MNAENLTSIETDSLIETVVLLRKKGVGLASPYFADLGNDEMAR
jgi:hypothetical protein